MFGARIIEYLGRLDTRSFSRLEEGTTRSMAAPYAPICRLPWTSRPALRSDGVVGAAGGAVDLGHRELGRSVDRSKIAFGDV
jgi:hypothetical protein